LWIGPTAGIKAKAAHQSLEGHFPAMKYWKRDGFTKAMRVIVQLLKTQKD
jgi:hypothetical protein